MTITRTSTSSTTVIFCTVILCLIIASLTSTADSAEQTPYQPDATISEIMEAIVMPSADVLWNVITYESTADGYKEVLPESDEDWDNLRRHAISLAEAANLLLIPNRKTATDSPAPDSTELSSAQIKALINNNYSAWSAFNNVLHTAALQAQDAISQRDAKALLEVSDALYSACEGCHQQFWYPGG